jgi:hypothetical protein
VDAVFEGVAEVEEMRKCKNEWWRITDESGKRWVSYFREWQTRLLLKEDELESQVFASLFAAWKSVCNFKVLASKTAVIVNAKADSKADRHGGGTDDEKEAPGELWDE